MHPCPLQLELFLYWWEWCLRGLSTVPHHSWEFNLVGWAPVFLLFYTALSSGWMYTLYREKEWENTLVKRNRKLSLFCSHVSSLRDEPSLASCLNALVPQGTLSEVIKSGAVKRGLVGLTYPHPSPTSLPRVLRKLSALGRQSFSMNICL